MPYGNHKCGLKTPRKFSFRIRMTLYSAVHWLQAASAMADVYIYSHIYRYMFDNAEVVEIITNPKRNKENCRRAADIKLLHSLSADSICSLATRQRDMDRVCIYI